MFNTIHYKNIDRKGKYQYRVAYHVFDILLIYQMCKIKIVLSLTYNTSYIDEQPLWFSLR